MEEELEILDKKYTEYEFFLNKLELKVREICNFNARITFCSGDRHLILNEDTNNLALLSCLDGKIKINKLSEEEHLKYCI